MRLVVAILSLAAVLVLVAVASAPRAHAQSPQPRATPITPITILMPTSKFAEGPPAESESVAERRILANVLADPRFHPSTWQDAVPSWLLPLILFIHAALTLAWNMIRWPFDRLLDLIGRTLSSPVVIVLFVVAIGGLIALYRSGIRSTILRQAQVDLPDEPLPPTAVEALSAAQTQASMGRYREACHFVLLSALLSIEEHGETRFDPSATNREHVWRVRSAARPAIERALASLVSTFDGLWYGGAAVTEGDYRRLLELASHVRESVA